MSVVLMTACLFACAFGTSAAFAVLQKRELRKRKLEMRLASGIEPTSARDQFVSRGLDQAVLAYVVRLQQRVLSDATKAVVPGKQSGGLARAHIRLASDIVRAGCSEQLSARSVAEGSLRLGLIGMACGVLLGAAISNVAMIVLGCTGAFAGGFAVWRALRHEAKLRTDLLEVELPEMLEIISLCLRSGMTFERGFATYGEHSDLILAKDCRAAQRQWTLGLKGREQALRDLASAYDSALFSRAIDTITRSLKFGVPLMQPLTLAAAEARAMYKAKREEEVAKAPVKMMIPTGMLILPAMLLFVLGPVLLELIG